MKKLIFFILSLITLNVYPQEPKTDNYIQLMSVYYKKGSPHFSDKHRIELLWDQGRYLSKINTCVKIKLTVYCDSSEYLRYGPKLLERRYNRIIRILSNDCGVNPNRINVVLMGWLDQTNNRPRANRRVDIDIYN